MMPCASPSRNKNSSCFPTHAQNMHSVKSMKQMVSKISWWGKKLEQMSQTCFDHPANTGYQNSTLSFSGFTQTVLKNKTLTHLTLSPCANVGLFNDMKTLSEAPADSNIFLPKWEQKCYRQLEESLEFPWNEVLNETWSDWQACSLFHWASLSFLSPSCRGERYTHLFYQIKSQCM